MEALVQPLAWAQWPRAVTPVFQAFRSEQGEKLVLEENAFVEKVVPGSVLRELHEKEMAEIRRPFARAGEDRRPTLSWPRQIPLGGEPAEVVEIVASYAEWLRDCEVPKLFVNGDPGAILRGDARDFCRSWINQREVTVPGIHFLQEDSPDEIGREVAAWLRELD